MKKALMTLMAFMMLALVMPFGAYAQDSANNETDTYDGGAFTIVPPAKWILVSGNLGDKELSKLPDNVREHYNQRNTDVLFMNIEGLDKPTQGFKDSLNIVMVNEPIPLTEELVKELTGVLKQQYESMFEGFESSSMEVIKLGERDALEVQGKYTILNYTVKMRQIFLPLKAESLVMTCTYEASREAEIQPLCNAAINSLVVK